MDTSFVNKLESLLKSEGYSVAERASSERTLLIFAAKGDSFAHVQVTQGFPVMGQAVPTTDASHPVAT